MPPAPSSNTACTPPAPADPRGHLVSDADTTHHHLLPRVLHLQKMALRTRWGFPLHKEVGASWTLTKVWAGSPAKEVREWTVHHLSLSLMTLQDFTGREAPELDHAAMPEVSPHTAAGDQALPSSRSLMMARKQAVNPNPPTRRRMPPGEDEDAEAGKGDAEVLSDGQVASDGKEGHGRTQIQNTLTGVSHVFGTPQRD